jgi:hypothetical protein
MCFKQKKKGPSEKDKEEREDSHLVDVVLLFRVEEKTTSAYYGTHTSRMPIDPPLYVSLPVKGTYKELYHVILQKLSRFFPETKTPGAVGESAEQKAQDPETQVSQFVLFCLVERKKKKKG